MFNILPAIRSAGGAQVPVLPVTADLVLQLDASTNSGANMTFASGSGDGDPVSQWTDVSGSGNHYTQGTGGLQPVWRANQFNGLGALQFDGTDDEFARAAILSGSTSPGSDGDMFCVMQCTDASNVYTGWPIRMSGSTSGQNGFGAYTDTLDRFGTVFGSNVFNIGFHNPFPTGVTRTLHGHRATKIGSTANLLKHRVNDTNGMHPAVLSAAGMTTGWGSTWRLGVDGDTTTPEYFGGYICEVLLYNGEKTRAEAQQIWEYLDEKWGIGLLSAPPSANLLAHWDDTTIVSGGDGTALTAWNDKTGNGWNLAPGGTAPTHRVANQNGLDTVDFITPNGDLSLDVSSSAPITGSNPGTVYCVCITDTAPGVNGQAPLWFSDASALNNHHPWTTGALFWNFGSTSRRSFSQAPADAVHNWHVLGGIADTNAHKFFIDGFKVFDTAVTAVDWIAVGGQPWKVGSGSSAGSYEGRIGEILLYGAQHDEATQGAISSFLRRKWGIGALNG